MSTKEEWVRVESESELRPGMTVEQRGCENCVRTERMVLLRENFRESVDSDGVIYPPRRGFFIAPPACDGSDGVDLELVVAEGALYRLSDLTDDSETTDATKELVTT